MTGSTLIIDGGWTTGMVKEIKLSNCIISENNYPFIIAEIGNNHNGDITIAKKLIDEAQKCGVNAVKFQTKILKQHSSRIIKQKLWGSKFIWKNIRA